MEMGGRGCIQCTEYEMRTAHLVEQENADTELINQKQDLSTRGDQDDTDITPPISPPNHMYTHSQPLPLFIGCVLSQLHLKLKKQLTSGLHS